MPAGGRPHTLTARVGPAGGQASYPLRVTAITVDYGMPAARAPVPATFGVLAVGSATGRAVSGWTAACTTRGHRRREA